MSLRRFLRRRTPTASPIRSSRPGNGEGSAAAATSDRDTSDLANQPEHLLAAAEVALRKGGLEEASCLYEELTGLHPNFLPAYLSAVTGFLRANRHDQCYAYLLAMERRFALEDKTFAKTVRTELNRRDPLLLSHEARLLERVGDDAGPWSLGTRRSPQAPALRSKRPVVHVYTVTFFDMDGQHVYPGGAERYIVDLARVLEAFGIGLAIFQAGRSYWKRYMGEIPVRAIPWSGSVYQLSIDFAAMTQSGFLNIYSPFTLAVAGVWKPSIGICHGVYWDTEGNSIFSEEVARDVFSALLHLDQCVSVDATSINVIRATRPDLAGEMRYIPNYAGEEFFDMAPMRQSEGRLRVLYPRRLYRARGYWLLAEIVPDLIAEIPNIEIIFLGDSDPEERAHVATLIARYPAHVKHRSAFPEEMPKHYAEADIVVVPTVNSEGTSLSALEALASGAAVIASDVGGLSNIILDEHNGLLIAPKAGALKAAILRLARDEALRADLQRNGKITARAFTKEKWARAWRQIVEQCELELPNEPPEPLDSPFVIFHPRTDGITWSNDGKAALPRQRPHHLLQALATLDLNVTLVEDSAQLLPVRQMGDRLEILGKDAQVYLNRGVIFIYYAYHIWALGDVGAQWLDTLSETERLGFESTHHKHDLRGMKTWFDLIDHPSLHENPLYSRAVELFIDHADYISTSSRILYGIYKERRPDIILLENACWPTEFGPQILDSDAPFDNSVINLIDARRGRGGKIFGYVGAIASWFDFALVERLAREFPMDEIVIVGRVSKDVEQKAAHLGRLSNVSFPGSVPYTEVPHVLARIDVAILPFHINKITDVTNPLKLYEYLASGIPVVATRLRELAEIGPTIPGLVRLAADAADFLAGAAEAKASLGQSFSMRAARKFAADNSWLHRAATVVDKIVKAGTDLELRDPEWSRRQGSLLAYNREKPGRQVNGSIGSLGSAPVLRFMESMVEPADVVGLRFPIFAPYAGIYRIDLLLRADGGEAALSSGRRWVVSLAGRRVAERSPLSASDVTRVLHVEALPAGIHYLAVELHALEHARAEHLGRLELARFEMSVAPKVEDEGTVVVEVSDVRMDRKDVRS